MIHPRTSAAALVLAAVALLSACGSAPAPNAAPPAVVPTAAPTAVPTAAPTDLPTALPTAAPTAAPTSVPTAAPTGVPADLRATIAAAVAALDQRGPYRMAITSTTDASTAELLVVPPDRSHYKATVQGTPVEIITIGATSYVLNPDGAWQTVTGAEGGVAAEAPLSAADLADITAPEALGAQQIGGVSAAGYRFGSASDPGTASTIWVGPDGAPVRLVVAGADATTTFDITYDPSITVEPPAS